MIFVESDVDHLLIDADALKTALQSERSEWDKIDKETLRASVGNFRQKIKRLFKKKDHHIENKYF